MGQIAQQNIQQKQKQEYFAELFKIVKNSVEGDKGKKGFIQAVKHRMQSLKVPEHVAKVLEQESERYMQIDEMSQESSIIKSYIEWISNIPFGK